AALFQRNKAGDRDEARRLLESALALDPTLIPIRVIMGNHAMAEQKWEDAERQFATALELVARQQEHGEYEISPWLIHFLRGCTLAHQRKLGEAMTCFEQALSINPKHTDSLWLLAQAREMVGDRDGMMSAYQRAVELDADSGDVLFALGSACLRGGALDAAEECLAGAVARYPERADFRLNHALCLIKRADLGGAREALAAIVQRWPQLTKARELQQLIERLDTHPQLGRLAAGALAEEKS